MKLCKDCKWFRDSMSYDFFTPAKCGKPTGEIDPVYGHDITVGLTCKEARKDVGDCRCGPDAKWFYPRKSWGEIIRESLSA